MKFYLFRFFLMLVFRHYYYYCSNHTSIIWTLEYINFQECVCDSFIVAHKGSQLSETPPLCLRMDRISCCWQHKLSALGQRRLLSLSQGNVCNRLEILRWQLITFVMCPGPTLPMATVDIKNPEINNVRFHNNSHVNNMVHSSLNKKEKKVKGKRKKLTKADIGTPSNFQ